MLALMEDPFHNSGVPNNSDLGNALLLALTSPSSAYFWFLLVRILGWLLVAWLLRGVQYHCLSSSFLLVTVLLYL